MPIERVIVKKGARRMELEEFLEKELGRAGYGGVDIRRTPTGTRVAVYVERPGIVIGRRGKSIKELTDELAQVYKLENPQVEVIELTKPEFCAKVMAKRAAFALERGISYRRVGHMMLRRIMRAGARGAEIVISGKIRGERAAFERFYDGYLKKAGEPGEELVSHGTAVAKLRPGIIGIKVRIMSPDVKLPDEVKLKEEAKAAEAPEPKPEPVVEGSGDTQA